MRKSAVVCLLAVLGCLVSLAAAVEFETHHRHRVQPHHQLQPAYGEYFEEPEESSRGNHAKKKLKKLKKRLLLQCLLEHNQRRRRRDTTLAEPSGRFFVPVAFQNTNVHVSGLGGGGSGSGAYGDPLSGGYGGGAGGCMQMLNDHGPLNSGLGSLLGPVGSVLSPIGSALSPAPVTEDLGGSRNGLYSDWNRYARQFHRNFVRPLYRLL